MPCLSRVIPMARDAAALLAGESAVGSTPPVLRLSIWSRWTWITLQTRNNRLLSVRHHVSNAEMEFLPLGVTANDG